MIRSLWPPRSLRAPRALRGSRIRIGIRCDAGPGIGVGHIVRCTALAEELTARGAEVVLLGDLGGVRLARQLTVKRGLHVVAGPAEPRTLAATARERSLQAMVLDSYALHPECGETLRDAGIRVLTIMDGEDGAERADIYLDQNVGAERRSPALPAGSVRLAGGEYVLLRDAVRLARAPEPYSPGMGPPHVLTFFGGTDAADVTPTLAELLAATRVPLTATMITPRRARVPPTNPGQSIKIAEPTDDLPRLAARADLVVAAAGSSTWELLHLGAPTALIWVAGNQRASYEATISRGLAIGLGGAAGLARSATARERLRVLLTEPDLRVRLSMAGRKAIDGAGRERVADALLAICHNAQRG